MRSRDMEGRSEMLLSISTQNVMVGFVAVKPLVNGLHEE